jgi:hypothetical protein
MKTNTLPLKKRGGPAPSLDNNKKEDKVVEHKIDKIIEPKQIGYVPPSVDDLISIKSRLKSVVKLESNINSLNSNGVPVEEPIKEETTQEKSVQDEPVQDEPVQDEPVQEESIQDEPVLEEPVLEEPVLEEPVLEEPVLEEPVQEDPVYNITIGPPTVDKIQEQLAKIMANKKNKKK